MKPNSILKLAMLVMIFIGLGVIPVASQPMAMSNETAVNKSFENAFENIVDDAQDAFQDILTDVTFEISGVEYSNIKIDFPDAIRSGYQYSQYHYPVFDDEDFYNVNVNVHQIHILFYQDDGADADEALSIFNRQKEILVECRTKRVGGEWQIEEENVPAAGGDGRYLSFIMKNEYQLDLKVKLNCRYTSVSASVSLDIVKEIEE